MSMRASDCAEWAQIYYPLTPHRAKPQKYVAAEPRTAFIKYDPITTVHQ